MGPRSRSRYPHAFSPGRGVPLVRAGSREPRVPNVMPPKPDLTLASLLKDNNSLKIVCTLCDKTKELSALEAIASYGGLLTFDEVRKVIWGRCRSKPCQARIGPGLKAYFRAGGA